MHACMGFKVASYICMHPNIGNFFSVFWLLKCLAIVQYKWCDYSYNVMMQGHLQNIHLTGFAKTRHNSARTEIHFLNMKATL